jgi:pyruvate-formate lyase-activating enzyme
LTAAPKAQHSTRRPASGLPLTALVADAEGRIIDLPGFQAMGMAGPDGFTPLTTADTIALPHGGELMMLPERRPVVVDLENGARRVLTENPYEPGQPVFAVSAFNSPGYVHTLTSAFVEDPSARILPLFSYDAVGWQAGGFRTPLIRVDREPRQDLRRMPRERIVAGVERMRRQMPDNRLRLHLERCALEYGCPAGKNFFLGRYEAPLPTSQVCNARCLGCISLQAGVEIRSSQDRIAFTPSPEEIAEVALAHIGRVSKAVVSFGQGCEGEPLLAAEAIVPAIRLIRRRTDRGTINLNTNASRPDLLAALLDAGLDSLRVSLNSIRPEAYTAYFRPRGYAFGDVVASIDLALARGRFVSINYLNCPGVTDAPEEVEALIAFIAAHPIRMIQWRNLNYDPLGYYRAIAAAASLGPPVGMGRLLDRLRKTFPRLMHGYFNPPREKWGRG